MKTEFNFTELNVPSYKGIILNKEDHSEIYKEAFSKASETFGKNSLAYKTITNGINEKNVTGSQFFWNTWLDQVGSLPGKIMLLEDWGKALSKDSNLVKGFYTDMPQLLLRSDKATWDKNQYLINDLSKKLKGQIEYSPENPILITGVKLKPSKAKDNEYGINLDITDAEIKSAPEFAQSHNKIKMGNIEKPLWTKSAGLSWLCLFEDGLGSNFVDLAGSSSYGRVAVLNAAGVLPESYLIKLKEEKATQVKEIEKRYVKAMNILKGK